MDSLGVKNCLADDRGFRGDGLRFPRGLRFHQLHSAGAEVFGQEHPVRRQLEDLDRGCVPGVDLDEPRFVIVLDVIDSKQSDQTKCRAQDIAQLTETRHQGRRNEAGADVPPIRKR